MNMSCLKTGHNFSKTKLNLQLKWEHLTGMDSYSRAFFSGLGMGKKNHRFGILSFQRHLKAFLNQSVTNCSASKCEGK